MRKIIWLIIFLAIILIIQNASALCEEGQIDINSASKEELQNIIQIGPVYAERIIQGRPFQSVDELIEVSGIGNITLNKIKQEGLACVNGETEKIVEEEEKVEENKEEDIEEKQDNQKNNEIDGEVKEDKEIEKVKTEDIEPNIIKLNTKSIKTENNKENSDKSNYAMYGFVFCLDFYSC